MDIDFHTTLGNTFAVGVPASAGSVSGNRKLLNRFEIVFMTDRIEFGPASDPLKESTGFGGNANKLMRSGLVLSNPQAIVSVLQTCVDLTVESLKSTETDTDPATERIQSASITELNIEGVEVKAKIQVVPLETEAWVDMVLNLPITRYDYGSS